MSVATRGLTAAEPTTGRHSQRRVDTSVATTGGLTAAEPTTGRHVSSYQRPDCSRANDGSTRQSLLEA
eukprot:6108877-Pyramimonas_sp.AAC.1